MYARSTTIQAQPSSIDAGIAHVRDEVMPALRDLEGCVGVSLLVDRESGRCIATSAWESDEAMRGSAERVAPIRDRAAQAFGGEVGMEDYTRARSDVFATGHDGSLRSNRVLAQLAGQYAIDLFIGSTLQMDACGNSSTVVRGAGVRVPLVKGT